MKLVIVESPTKAKTIGKFLGRPYTVVASYGHVRDLPKSKIGVDVEHDFTPQYTIPIKAKKAVTDLKKLTGKAEAVILATDEDREGEAIAWHLVQALELVNSTGKRQKSQPEAGPPRAEKLPKIVRIAFHEITTEAIKEALEHPRDIDMKLVDAQQARRILDRLVGYELSPFLWRKIYRGLSAGRVQSVAVRLIVEREREIRAFVPQEYWTIESQFATSAGATLTAKLHARDGTTLDKFALPNGEVARALATALEGAAYKVSTVKQRRVKKNAPGPFTTSLLQQEASSRLGMSPAQTMVLAQQLYEGVALGDAGSIGLITYMRTDSMNLAEKFLTETQRFLKVNFGANYALESPRRFKAKAKNAQEAHEAIRPTDVDHTPESVAPYLDSRQQALYELIWRRTVASQMPEAEIDTTTVDIATTDKVVTDGEAALFYFRATGSVTAFDGWRHLYPVENGEQELPAVKEGEAMKLLTLTPLQHFTEPAARYSEATLIKALEEYGIGRPSTYAPTMSTIVERGYVERVDRRLKPTELAELVNDLLVEHFPKIVDYQFTAHVEEELDDIAAGTKQMVPVLEEFYGPFKQNLTEKEATLSKQSITEETTDEVCDKCGKPMVKKLGRFGKFLACSGYPECKNTKPLPGSAEAEKTTEVCDQCNKPMAVKRGRFGLFLGCSGYPECKNIKRIEKKTGVNCPQCGQGDIVEKKSRKFGKIFYSCNRYPDCAFSLWSKPTGEKCPTCQSLLVFGAKGSIRCSKKGCAYKRDSEAMT